MSATREHTPEADAASLLRRLGRALHRLERDRICCGDVTRQQFATLRLVHESGGLTTSEIASRLGIDLSTASRNLAVLGRERCLRRRASPGDARAVRHEVTAHGRACLDELCCDERDTLAAALQHLPARDRPAVARALALLAPALERAASADDDRDAADAGAACAGGDCGEACAPPAARRGAVRSSARSGTRSTARRSAPGTARNTARSTARSTVRSSARNPSPSRPAGTPRRRKESRP